MPEALEQSGLDSLQIDDQESSVAEPFLRLELKDGNVFEIEKSDNPYFNTPSSRGEIYKATVVVKNNQGEVIHGFISDLPKFKSNNWQFVLLTDGGSNITIDNNMRQIIIRDNSIKSSKDILAFLHEVGHINLGAKPVIFPKKELARLSKDEREAWAWGLKRARRLRGEGVDLLGEFEGYQGFVKWLHQAKDKRLSGYEEWFAGDDQKLRGIFSKKYYQKDKEK